MLVRQLSLLFVSMKENKFQHNLIEKLKDRFPGAMVLKNDPNYIQGVPDLTILFKNHWAALECKKEAKANRQPNQEYYISKMDNMSFARFISPENEQEVLDELEQSFSN